jgi:FkbM family methyltransferase
MSLQEIHDRYHAGGMTMAEYVAEMQQVHRQLLDYPAFLRLKAISRIEIDPEGVVLTCKSSGLKLRYDDPEDQYAALTLLNLGEYEAEELEALARFSAAQAGTGAFTFLDVGANFGWYALNLALRFPAATVHAFEPVAATFRSLERNLAANALANVHLHQLGLLDQAGRATFFCDPRISGRASVRNLAEDPAALPMPCPVTRLDDFVAAHGVAPDVIKVDVEGAELMVFQGGLATLTRHRPLIMAEMLRKWARKFAYHPNDILALMAGLGYRCCFLDGPRLRELPTMTDAITATNFFFLHRERHAALMEAL